MQSTPCNEINLEDDIFNHNNSIDLEKTDMQGVMVDESLVYVGMDILMEDTIEEYDDDAN